MVMEEVDPWGQRRDDYRAGMIAWMISGGRGQVSDYILDFFRPAPTRPRQQSVTEMETILSMWIKGSNISFAEQRIGQA